MQVFTPFTSGSKVVSAKSSLLNQHRPTNVAQQGVKPVHNAADLGRSNTASSNTLKVLLVNAAKAGCMLAATTTLLVSGASARLEGVNKPELLPNEYTPVIDVAGFLTPGELKRIRTEVENIERDTGVKLRVLAQNYPTTPGLAIKDFWGVDDDTVVFVADPNTGNILNFNVGKNVDLLVPRSFWSRLAGKYGTKFYWQNNGQETAIVNAVSAIDTCLREPPGRLQCSKVQGELGEQPSSGPLGKAFFGS